MNIPTIPKSVVINAGYLGAIIVFMAVGILSVAVFMPKLVKPVYTAPTAHLEAKLSYTPYAYPGDTWSASVILYENSRATAHDIEVKIVSKAFGSISQKEDLMMPFTTETFNLTTRIPNTLPPGKYNGTLIITAKEAKPSTYGFTFTILPSSGGNNTNS